MRRNHWGRAKSRSVVSIAVAAVAASVLSVLAFTYEGFTTTDVDLNDAGVWVTKTSTNQFARLNVTAEELDGGLTTRTDNFDVLQDDDTVLMVDYEAGAVQQVDEAALLFAPAVAVPGLQVGLAGGTVTLFDPITGDLTITTSEALSGFSADDDPTFELGENAAVTIGPDGTVAAASTDDEVVVTWTIESGEVLEPQIVERPELASAEDLQIALLGDDVVVLDGSRDRLLLPEAVVDSEPGAVLQQSGTSADQVVLTTGEYLIVQPLDGRGSATQRFGVDGGTAVAALQRGGCVYAVWPTNATFLRDCQGSSRDLKQLVEELVDGPMVFRERHGAVVLNHFVDGNSWIVTDNVVLVNNWEAMLPEESDETTESEEESIDETIVNQPPPTTEENRDPTANDDDFGVRPGRSTPLPVLWNDTDPDGDILTVEVSEGAALPNGVRAVPVANDSRLQIEVPDDYDGGNFTVPYSVFDGRGGSDDATLAVSISQPSENSPPELLTENPAFQVEQTRDVTYQALQDWHDPDGDELLLVDAVPESDDTVQVSPGGTVRYTATGDAGETSLTLRVSDGTDEGEDTLTVDVVPRGESTPIANADFVATVPGVPVTIEPLANDYVAGNSNARLAAVNTENANIEVQSNLAEGTVTIVNGPVGISYLTYQLAVGPTPVLGRIRVDIRPPDEAARPIAVRDVGLLPQNNDTLVDLLQNDIDPAGGVLIVQQVTVPGNASVAVQLIGREIIRISDNGLDSPVELEYTVSNGTEVDTGTILVIPVPPPTTPRAPTAVPDSWVLREGDYTTIPILDNDFSADGLDFSVTPELVSSSLDTPDEDDVAGSVAFIDDDVLRLTVPVGGPSRVELVYEITDESGQADTASVTVDIVRRDPDANDPPNPQTVTARVLAGSDVRIPIPLDGTDPDGDGVALVRAESGSEQGRIIGQGAGYFDFHAEPTATGTVSFTYQVRDRWGAVGTARVVVGIAQPGAANQAPTTVTDVITVAPERAIAFDVLSNDSDPDGDSIFVDTATSTDIDGVEVGEDAGTVDFVSPVEPGQYVVSYVARDARGAVSNGSLVVTVSEDAAPIAPVAVDDEVLPADAVAETPIVVDVLENDLDLDGDPSVLVTSVLEGGATLATSGIQVTPLADDFQVVTYQVTDPDGLTAEAFIFVPQAGRQPPWLIRDTITVPSHNEVVIPLDEFVGVSSDNQPRLISDDRVSASFSDGSGLVVDEHTLRYQSALNYRGEASITFAVTDGTSAEDPEGLVNVLTIAIEVTDSSEVPPEFASPSLIVAQGETSPLFSLRAATQDPDPGDLDAMQYEIAGAPSLQGVSADILDDSQLSLSAGFDAQPGDSGSVPIRVTDRAGNTVEGTIFITVVPSTLPLAQVRDHAVDAVAGEAVTIPALQDAFNPFADQGVGLRIVEATALTAGASSVTTDETSVTVTPDAEFSGQLQVRYTVQDRTETVERQVIGAITVTVRNRPDTPNRPNIASVGNGTVTATWLEPFANGSPITGYRVESVDGSFAQECAATTCVLEGLTNNQVYNFVVIAINDIGESDPSPPSADARPDTAPDQPAAPTVVRGDGQVELSWTPPANEGSPIVNYTIEISPAPAGGAPQVVVAGGVTNYTWQGLANGTAYTFRIQAQNSAPEPSEWSPYSDEVTPAGRPFQVQGVTAARTEFGSSVQIRVQWQVGDANGDPISQYLVTPYYNGAARTPIPVAGTETSLAFDGSGNVSSEAGSYTFTVQAVNSVGTSDPSAATAPIRDATTPGAPTNVQGTDADSSSVITFQPGPANGAEAGEISYEYRVGQNVGGAIRSGDSIALANNGGPYTVYVRAISLVDGHRYESPWSAPSNQIRPYGPIGQPTITHRILPGEVRFNVTLPPRNGRDVTATYTLNGQRVAAADPIVCRVAAGRDCNLRVDVDAGQSGTSQAQDSATVPNPPLTLERGPDATSPHNQVSASNFILHYNSELPIVEYRFQCFDASGAVLGTQGRWTPTEGQTSTSRTEYTFCVSDRGGPYRLELYYGDVTYIARP